MRVVISPSFSPPLSAKSAVLCRTTNTFRHNPQAQPNVSGAITAAAWERRISSLAYSHVSSDTPRFFNIGFQSLLDDPFPLKINSLKVDSNISGIDLLLQKVGSFLENLNLRIYDNIEQRKAYESVVIYCNKIKFLNLSYIYNLLNLSKLKSF